MKCIVLAGGSSDRLWPLSRREYPKQFMEIREGRSMFQDTVLRNIPFCDEFIIVTNKKYANVARGQMQVFQELEYSFIFEEVALKTAPAVIMCALKCKPEEELLIVFTDCIIEGDYNANIMQLRDVVSENRFAAIACKPTNGGTNYHFVKKVGYKVIFGGKRAKNSYWDCGIIGVKARVLLRNIDKKLLEECKRININDGVINREECDKIAPCGLNKVIDPNNCTLIDANFAWTRITDISSIYNYYDKAIKNDKNALSNNCKGVEIINTVDDRFIIANGLKNVVIVNTRDALYVTNSTSEAEIKDISSKYYSGKRQYFDVMPRKYETWGTEEVIGTANDCKIKQIIVFPQSSFEYRAKKNIVTNMFVSQGKMRLGNKNSETDYVQYQNVTISGTSSYTVFNTENEDLVLVCTEKTIKSGKFKQRSFEYLVKLQPALKDNLWGGTKIRDIYGKNVGDMDIIAESWELSTHPDGQSKIASGMFAGKTLTEYIDAVGKDKLGWKAQTYDKLSIMVKFIDARQNLSVQVHPADPYAMTVEGEYGKSEMWHILDADEDACIYVGFNKDVTADEIKEHIKNNTLMQVLNKIPVKKNDTYFLKAGTVHAIGSGCMICEVQQASNITYRLYDYGRRDKNGNLRELHIDRAIDVLNMKKYTPHTYEKYEAIVNPDYVKTLIGQCKYFTVNKLFIDGECVLPAIESSFQAFVALEGNGSISDGYTTYEFKAGDTLFCTNLEQISIKGKCSVLSINI